MFDFIVLNDSGTPLYIHSADGDKDKNVLISGFLSAINSYIRDSVSCNLSSITLGGRDIIFSYNNNLNMTYVIISDVVKNKRESSLLADKLSDLSSEFEKRFRDKFSNWDGNQGLFSGFDDYFAKKKKHFWQ